MTGSIPKTINMPELETINTDFLQTQLRTIESMLTRMSQQISGDDDVNDPQTQSFYRLYSSTIRLYMSVHKFTHSPKEDPSEETDSTEVMDKNEEPNNIQNKEEQNQFPPSKSQIADSTPIPQNRFKYIFENQKRKSRKKNRNSKTKNAASSAGSYNRPVNTAPASAER